MTVAKPRLIIADTDINYIIPLQAKFAEEFPGEIDLEIITEPAYFEQAFRKPAEGGCPDRVRSALQRDAAAP